MFEIIYRYDPARQRQVPANAEEACRCLADGNRLFEQRVDSETIGALIPMMCWHSLTMQDPP